MKGIRRICIAVSGLAGTFSAWAQTAFVPNDPYFYSGTAGGAQAGYYGEWTLDNQAPLSALNAGLDVNIQGAWQRGLTGQGVIIGIVDTGVEGDHPDLAANFVNAYSWDFGKTQASNLADTLRGQPYTTDDSHGTAVAGVSAAVGGNGLGLTGAAPYAGLSSERYVGDSAEDTGYNADERLAAAILYQGQTDANGNPDPYALVSAAAPVRVKNYSFGVESGYVTRAQESLILSALAQSAAQGVLNVVAAGNQNPQATNPRPTEDANKATLQNDLNALTVSALGSDGKLSRYSSYGANIIVTAPSNSTGDLFAVPSTDRSSRQLGYNDTLPDRPELYLQGDNGSYTSRFGGTSSAAPLVAGIMALGVQARPDLDLHLARQALARTSVQVDASDASWVTNAAGYHFSNKYGFGLINADGFTAALQDGLTVAETKTETTGLVTVGQTFAASTALSAGATAAFTHPLPIECVQVTLTITGLQTDLDAYDAGQGSLAGDISGYLTSPSGTRDQLFLNDRDIPENGRNGNLATLTWSYLSYAYFGEEVNGLWTLELDNFHLDGAATWENFSLNTVQTLVVPEPSACHLAALALFGFIVWRRFTRQRQA